MQLWPELTVRARAAQAAAATGSASSSTRNGSLPPSSSTVFFSSFPQRDATAEPAPSLPVSVAARTAGSRRTDSTWFEVMSSVWKAPAGKPASVKISSIVTAHRGTLAACFNSATLPAMRAGAAKRKTCQKGKFQGITARIGPRGSKRT